MHSESWLDCKLPSAIHRGSSGHKISHSADKSANKVFSKMANSKLDASYNKINLIQMQINNANDNETYNNRYQKHQPFSKSVSQREDRPIESRRRSSKNNGYISHLFNVMRRKSTDRSEKRASSQDLKQELDQLGSNPNKMAPCKVRSSKKQISLHSLPKQKLQSTKATSINSINSLSSHITGKHLKTYSQFICSARAYNTQVDYSHLRDLEKFHALAAIDIKEYKIVESLILCLIDAFNGDQVCSDQLVMEYCVLYFQNEERRKFQIVFNCHILKSFADKIRALYAYARLWMFLLYKLAQNELAFESSIRAINLRGCRLIHQILKIMFEAVSQSISRTNTTVFQAFKSLKVVKQLQRIQQQFVQLKKQLEAILYSELQSTFSAYPQFLKEFNQIFINLKPFMSESSFYHQEEYLSRVEIVLSWRYLHVPPIPYLPQKITQLSLSSEKYTLVMGLSKVIVLYNPNTRVLKYRPYMDTFLSILKELYEFVVFSDFEKQITDRIIKEIEKGNKCFDFRLYRPHMSFKDGKIVKNISRLGRSLQQTVFLDVKPYLSTFPQNQLQISEYKPPAVNQNPLVREKCLLSIMGRLQSIHKQYPGDIRKAINRTSELTFIPEAETIEEYSISVERNRSDPKSIL